MLEWKRACGSHSEWPYDVWKFTHRRWPYDVRPYHHGRLLMHRLVADAACRAWKKGLWLNVEGCIVSSARCGFFVFLSLFFRVPPVSLFPWLFLSICLQVCMSICSSLCACLYACLSICLAVCLSFSLCVSLCLSVFDLASSRSCLSQLSFFFSWARGIQGESGCLRAISYELFRTGEEGHPTALDLSSPGPKEKHRRRHHRQQHATLSTQP